MRELPVYTGGEAAIRFSLAPVSPTLEHFNKMVEAVPKDFHEKFSEVVRNYGVLYDKGCTDFKDKTRKHKPGFKVVIQWA